MSTNERDLDYDRFIAHLLEHGTLKAAADAMGIAYITARRWYAKPAVRLRYDEARRDVVRLALTRLQAALAEAVETLVRNLGPEQPAAIQVRAAQVLLEAAIRSNDLLDLDARLAALEHEQVNQPAYLAGPNRGYGPSETKGS